MRKRLLSLFSGCGGMDLGFHGDFWVHQRSIANPDWIQSNSKQNVLLNRTDFDIVFANDILKSAKDAWSHYFKSHSISSDIFKVDSIVNLVIQHRKTKNTFPENIDIVTGGFPCQDFSIAGKRLAFKSHKSHEGESMASYENPKTENRGELYMWMREVVSIVKPKVFIAENVKGMNSIPTIVDTIKKDFESIEGEEYLVLSPKIIHAGNYGVPQSRERLFFIGLKVSALKEEALNSLSGMIEKEEYDLYPPISHYLPLPERSPNKFT
jgi:DNA (cytosine-5)-methyltransferase 1